MQFISNTIIIMYIVRTLFFLADSNQSADGEEEASLKAQVNQPLSHIRHTRYIRTYVHKPIITCVITTITTSPQVVNSERYS